MDCSGGLSLQRYQELSDVKRLVDQFNKCGEIAKANGLRFASITMWMNSMSWKGKIPFE